MRRRNAANDTVYRRAVRSTNMSSSEQLRAQVVRRSDVIGMGPVSRHRIET